MLSFDSTDLDLTDLAIIGAVAQTPGIGSRALERQVSLSPTSLRRRSERLIALGLLNRTTQPPRSRFQYTLGPNLPSVAVTATSRVLAEFAETLREIANNAQYLSAFFRQINDG